MTGTTNVLRRGLPNTVVDLRGPLRTSVRSTEKPGADSSILSLGTFGQELVVTGTRRRRSSPGPERARARVATRRPWPNDVTRTCVQGRWVEDLCPTRLRSIRDGESPPSAHGRLARGVTVSRFEPVAAEVLSGIDRLTGVAPECSNSAVSVSSNRRNSCSLSNAATDLMAAFVTLRIVSVPPYHVRLNLVVIGVHSRHPTIVCGRFTTPPIATGARRPRPA